MEQHPCIQCNVNVTSRSHAVACDACGRWNHRKCGTDITHQQYMMMRRGDISIAWRCTYCEVDVVDRTRHNSTASDDLLIPPPQMEITDLSPMRSVDVRRDEIPDRTFNVTGRDFNQTLAPLENSLPDRHLNDEIPDESPVTYEIVEAGTKRSAPKLVSSDGYTYTRGVKVGERRYWRCSIRNKKTVCPASVKEFMGQFTTGIGGHVHPADPGPVFTKNYIELGDWF